MIKRFGAQITFRQSDDGETWRGQLVNSQARDRHGDERQARAPVLQDRAA
jgi:hypothetical protein